jgi:hypothetical protein
MSSRVLVGSAVVAGLVVLGLADVVAHLSGLPVGAITRDAQSTQHTSAAVGAVSLFNDMAWAVAGALSLFVAWASPVARPYMLVFGMLMFILAADDSLMLHEIVGPKIVGIPELAFFALYALLAVWVLWLLVRSKAPRNVTFTYLLGGCFLAASVLADLTGRNWYLVEDGAKLLGTLVWITLPLMAYDAQRRQGTDVQRHDEQDARRTADSSNSDRFEAREPRVDAGAAASARSSGDPAVPVKGD